MVTSVRIVRYSGFYVDCRQRYLEKKKKVYLIQ